MTFAVLLTGNPVNALGNGIQGGNGVSIVINSKFIRCLPPFSLLVWINNGGSQPQPPGSSACTLSLIHIWLDIIPTVHEGVAVRQMEKRGIQTNIGNLNREIRAANRLMKSIRQLIQNLKGWITELGEKRKELLAQKAAEEATLLPNLLMKYMEIRKEERKDWTRACLLYTSAED